MPNNRKYYLVEQYYQLMMDSKTHKTLAAMRQMWYLHEDCRLGLTVANDESLIVTRHNR